MKLIISLTLALLLFPFSINAQTLSAQIESSTGISCFGANDGFIAIRTSGGSGPYTYELDSNGELQSDRVFTRLAPGQHVVRVRDAFYDFVDITFDMEEPDKLDIGIRYKVDVNCYGEHTAELMLEATGGVGNYKFSLDQQLFSSSPSFKSLSAGPYSIAVQDSNECMDDSLVIINSKQAVRTFVSKKKELACFGDTDARIELRTFGGWGMYQYSLDGITYQTRPYFDNLASGMYQIYTQDSAGCIHELQLQITEPDLLVQQTTKHDVSCYGRSNGRISIASAGGEMPHYYSLNGSNFTSSNEYVSLEPGIYNVQTRDLNGCRTGEEQLEITEPSKLEVSLSTTDVSCKGEKTGSVEIAVVGGIPPYSLTWNGEDSLNTLIHSELSAGNYYVLAEDQNGCNEAEFVRINEPDSSFSLTLKGFVDPTCGKATGEMDISASNGQSPIDYQWSHDAGLQGDIARQLEAGSYEVRATDAMGCEASLQADLTNQNYVVASFTTFPDINTSFTAMQGEISFLNRSKGATNFAWDFGDQIGYASDPNPRYTYQAAGNYEITLIATDEMGLCHDTITQQIQIKADEWVEVPDAFSPDGNGINDVFLVIGSGIQHFEMTFFDSWGRKLKESRSILDGWDGLNQKGKRVLPGIYAYKMKVIFDSGFVLERAGGVVLLR